MTQTELITYGLNHEDPKVKTLAEYMKDKIELDLKDYRDFEKYNKWMDKYDKAQDRFDAKTVKRYARKLFKIMTPMNVFNKIIKIQLGQL